MQQKFMYLSGWLNGGESMRSLAELVGRDFELLSLMDIKEVMKISDYANMIASKIKDPVYLVGHSFGAKIAIATAALYPEKVSGIFVISGPNRGKLIFRLLKPAIKLAKLLGFKGDRFQSSDYRGLPIHLKKTMQKTLAFNIIPLLRKVKCKMVFIYGTNDRTTKPALGKKFAKLGKETKYFQLNGFNHNSIISDGIYQVSGIIKSEVPHI